MGPDQYEASGPDAAHIYEQRILILDFGSQYTQLIARRVREIGVYCEIYPWFTDNASIKSFSPTGIILSGSPASIGDHGRPTIPDIVFDFGCPVLGICYGMQMMVDRLGGQVESKGAGEFGYAQVVLHGHSELLSGIEDHTTQAGESLLDVWMSHGDRVTQLPEGFQCIASTTDIPIAGIAHPQKQFYGLQFHPEVTHTRQGQRILERFVKAICGCEGRWTPSNIINAHIHEIREHVGGDKVLLGLSGGVDSAVTAALIHKAIGDQLVCVFVDTGLLREKEPEFLQSTFKDNQGIDVICVDARERFLAALEGIHDPEQKRRVIGEMFIEVFEEQAKQLTDVAWLAQGTIYPDVIESAAVQDSEAQVIKSHHNVGGLPERMHLKLLEPLRELFKDEVRRLGLELGLPYDRVYRHPFPGPGLAVRLIGEVKPEYLTILRRADAIFIEELEQWDLYYASSQAFAVFLPVKSVGVRGDARYHEYVIVLRVVETQDYMTAEWKRLPNEFLSKVARRIVNEVQGVSRVVYDITSKPPATIEWE